MTDLILRMNKNPRDPKKPVSLEIRDHGPAETNYSHIAYVSLEMADEIERSGAPFWLFGRPACRDATRDQDDL